MRKFKTGDIVVLKSGGPKMTITEYHSTDDADKRISCKWFDQQTDELKFGTFLEDELQKDE